MELALPLLLPSRLALLNFLDPAIGGEVLELYSNVCMSMRPTTSIRYRRQIDGVMREMRARSL